MGPTQSCKNTQRNPSPLAQKKITVFALENNHTRVQATLVMQLFDKEKSCLNPFFPPTTMDCLHHRCIVVFADCGGKPGRERQEALYIKESQLYDHHPDGNQ